MYIIAIAKYMDQNKFLVNLFCIILSIRFKPSSKMFIDHSKAVLLLWIIYVLFLSYCVCYVFGVMSPDGKGLTSWLSIVVSNCEFVIFPLASWVKCGT